MQRPAERRAFFFEITKNLRCQRCEERGQKTKILLRTYTFRHAGSRAVLGPLSQIMNPSFEEQLQVACSKLQALE